MDNNILDGLVENKKSLLLVLVLTIVVIIISILNLFLNNSKSKFDVEGAIESFAQLYYEESYYPNITSEYSGDYKQMLQNDSVDGIKLNLRTIISTFDVDAENFYSEGNYCNFLKTYALIYPKSPYGLTDYEIKVVTSCDKKI